MEKKDITLNPKAMSNLESEKIPSAGLSRSEMAQVSKYLRCLSLECGYCTELTNTFGSCNYETKQLGKHRKSPRTINLRNPCHYKLFSIEQSLPKFIEGPCLPYDPKKQENQDQEETYHTCPGDAPFEHLRISGDEQITPILKVERPNRKFLPGEWE